MNSNAGAAPEGFGPILRTSPVLEALGYMLVARSGARAGEWLQVHLDRTEEDGRKTLAHARLMAGDRLVAEASLLFIDAPPRPALWPDAPVRSGDAQL